MCHANGVWRVFNKKIEYLYQVALDLGFYHILKYSITDISRLQKNYTHKKAEVHQGKCIKKGQILVDGDRMQRHIKNLVRRSIFLPLPLFYLLTFN